MLGDLLSGLFGGLLGGSLSEKVSARKARRLQEQSRVECALRVVEGRHPGLTEKWRHGVADLSPGVVDLGWASSRCPRSTTAPYVTRPLAKHGQ